MKMTFLSLCRTCLSPNLLEPIFNYEDDNARASDIFITTGVKVDMNDGLPQQICKNCLKVLFEALKFRKQSKDAEEKLLKIKNKNNGRNCINITIENIPLGKDDKVPLSGLKNISKRKCEDAKVEADSDVSQDSNLQEKIITKGAIELNNQLFCNNNKVIKIKKETITFDDETSFQILFKNLIDTNHEIKEIAKNNEQENYNDNIEYNDPQYDNSVETDVYKCNEDYAINTKSIRKTKTKRVKSIKEISNNDNILYIVQDSKRVTCKLCQKDLSIRSIDFHLSKSHPGADDRRVKCELCDAYITKERLTQHNVRKHGDNCFRCAYCHIEFNTKELLIAHSKTCTEKIKKRKTNQDKRRTAMVECEVCQKVMQKGSLKMHMGIKHRGMAPICEHCSRTFSNKLRLQEHLRAKHGYEKFKCSMCDFTSASTTYIKNHERRHRGEKPFVCEICGADFHANYLLAQHTQSHRTQKLMKCDQCPAAFKANNTLHMHKITCHNKHIYQCNLCPRTFRCRWYVVKHVRTFHRHSGPVGDLHRIAVSDHTMDTIIN